MAKGNMLLGFSRGKVGDLVFKRLNGQQVTVPRVRDPKNPRSDSQTIQRIAFASASKTAQALRGIVDHSFQGYKYGGPSVNHFVGQLAKELRAYMTSSLLSPSEAPYGTAPILPYQAAGVGAAATALVSSGDLRSIPFGLEYDSEHSSYGLQIGQKGLVTISNMLTVTVADYEQVFGVPSSDQVTIIEGVPEALEYIGEEIFQGVRFDFLRWNLKENLTGSETIFVANGSVTGTALLNPGILDMERTDPRVTSLIFIAPDSDDLQMLVGVGTEGATFENIFGSGLASDVVLAGVIVSRYEAGVWRRNMCRLVRTPHEPQASSLSYQDTWAFNDIASVMILAVPEQAAPAEDEYLNKKKAAGVA